MEFTKLNTRYKIPYPIFFRLVSFVLGKEKEYLVAYADKIKLNKRDIQRLDRVINDYKAKKPIAYILEEIEFFGFKFYVNQFTLIPRPETEFLVEKGIEYIESEKKKNLQIIDIGTGSGNIIISLFKNLSRQRQQSTKFFATDISKKALNVAKYNALNLLYDKAEKIKFVHCKLLPTQQGNFDLVLANLPYIPSLRVKRLDKSVSGFEPRVALDGGEHGAKYILELIKILVKMNYLAAKGLALFEIDRENVDSLKRYLTGIGNIEYKFMFDNYKRLRYLMLKRR